MKFGDLIKQLLIYNVTFLLIYSNLLQGDITQTTALKSNEFKKNVGFIFEKLHIGNKQLVQILEVVQSNPVLVFQSTLGLLFFFSFLSILTQRKVFNFFFTVLFGILAGVFYNPILPENKIAAPFGIRKELILSLGIIIVMFVNIFNPEGEAKDSKVEDLKEKEITSEPKRLKKKNK